MREGGFDAAFIAVGAHLSRRTDIPARDAGKMLDAVSFLKEVETGAAPNSAAGSRSTAAATRPWMRPGLPSASALKRP